MFKDPKYFYYSIASLGGLLLIVIGLVSLLNLGFSSFIFKTKAPDYGMSQPPDLKGYVGELKEKEGLTKAQKESIESWQKDYEDWRNKQKDFDPTKDMNKAQLSLSLAMLLVGLPIFLYHVKFVRKSNFEHDTYKK